MKKLLHIYIVFLLMSLAGCHPKGSGSWEKYSRELYAPHYASGFSIWGSEAADSLETASQSTLIEVKDPWQGAQGVVRHLFVARGGEEPPQGYEGPVLRGEARRIVTLSSSHIAMLDALGCVERVVGVSGLDFVHNPYICDHRDRIGDVGYDGNFNYELLLALKADLVLLYGVFGPSVLEPKLKELGIPYLYVGDYVEQSPLGKAEWMVALGEAVGMRSQAEEHFATLPPQYDYWRTRAAATTHRPKVMLNTPYADSWFMPWPTSFVARLIADAGGDYLYRSETTETGSQTIDIEEAMRLTAEADVWLDVSNVADLEALKRLYPRLADLKCVVRGEVWNNDRRSRIRGGNDYWESGVVNPHLILRDLIKIFHPELVEEEFSYYRKL